MLGTGRRVGLLPLPTRQSSSETRAGRDVRGLEREAYCTRCGREALVDENVAGGSEGRADLPGPRIRRGGQRRCNETAPPPFAKKGAGGLVRPGCEEKP